VCVCVCVCVDVLLSVFTVATRHIKRCGSHFNSGPLPLKQIRLKTDDILTFKNGIK